jgi:hypothetical protein
MLGRREIRSLMRVGMMEKRREGGGVSIDIFSVCWSDDIRRDRRDILSDSGEIRIEFMYQVVRLSGRKGPCKAGIM